jgi:hypothetical protein
VYEVKVEAETRPEAMSVSRVSFRIEDKSADPGASALRRNEIAGHIRTALSAQGLYEAPDATTADLVVEISYGIGPARTQRTVYQELAYGRPVMDAQRLGPPPEGVAREMMGYTELATTTVTHEKHLSICARANRANQDEKPAEDLWRVHVSIENESEDLRGHLAVLTTVAMDHMGRATHGPAAITLRSDDEAIRFVKKGL